MSDSSPGSFADFVESLRYPTGAARGSEWQTSEDVSFPPGVEHRLEAFARAFERRNRRIFGLALGTPAKAPAILLTGVTRAQEFFVLNWLVTRLTLRRYSFDPRDFRTKTPNDIAETIAPLYDTHASIVHVNGVDGVAWAWMERALAARFSNVCVVATATSGATLEPAMLDAFDTHVAWTDDDGRAPQGAGAFVRHP